jgi:hypothetical protein
LEVHLRHINSLILTRPEVQAMCSRWSMTSWASTSTEI